MISSTYMSFYVFFKIFFLLVEINSTDYNLNITQSLDPCIFCENLF